MTYSHDIPEPILAADLSHPALANSAVAHCCMAWKEAAEIDLATKHSSTGWSSRHVYRQALPPLSGYENIRDFIACVAHGLLIEAIDEKIGSKLLYAAQVAMSSLKLDPASVDPHPPTPTPLPPPPSLN